MHSISLTLSSSFCVNGLIQRCYVRNDKTYKLTLLLLNFQDGTKPININSTCIYDQWAAHARHDTSTARHCTLGHDSVAAPCLLVPPCRHPGPDTALHGLAVVPCRADNPPCHPCPCASSKPCHCRTGAAPSSSRWRPQPHTLSSPCRKSGSRGHHRCHARR
jgi:hypothetical protein